MRPLVLALCAIASSGCAGVRLWDGYLGAGGLAGTIRSDHPSIDGQGGAGMQVLLGYDFTPSVTWDTRFGGMWIDVAPPPEIVYPADSGGFAFFATGVVVRFGHEAPGSIRPFLGLHAAYQAFQFDSYLYQIDALGGALSGGVELPLGDRFALRLGGTATYFTGSSTYDARASGSVLLVTLDALYLTRR